MNSIAFKRIKNITYSKLKDQLDGARVSWLVSFCLWSHTWKYPKLYSDFRTCSSVHAQKNESKVLIKLLMKLLLLTFLQLPAVLLWDIFLAINALCSLAKLLRSPRFPCARKSIYWNIVFPPTSLFKSEINLPSLTKLFNHKRLEVWIEA